MGGAFSQLPFGRVDLSVHANKRASTLAAEAARVGAELRILDDDRGAPLLILSRGAMTRSFGAHDLDDLELVIGGMRRPV
jgi:hypothetical protein